MDSIVPLNSIIKNIFLNGNLPFRVENSSEIRLTKKQDMKQLPAAAPNEKVGVPLGFMALSPIVVSPEHCSTCTGI